MSILDNIRKAFSGNPTGGDSLANGGSRGFQEDDDPMAYFVDMIMPYLKRQIFDYEVTFEEGDETKTKKFRNYNEMVLFLNGKNLIEIYVLADKAFWKEINSDAELGDFFLAMKSNLGTKTFNSNGPNELRALVHGFLEEHELYRKAAKLVVMRQVNSDRIQKILGLEDDWDKLYRVISRLERKGIIKRCDFGGEPVEALVNRDQLEEILGNDKIGLREPNQKKPGVTSGKASELLRDESSGVPLPKRQKKRFIAEYYRPDGTMGTYEADDYDEESLREKFERAKLSDLEEVADENQDGDVRIAKISEDKSYNRSVKQYENDIKRSEAAQNQRDYTRAKGFNRKVEEAKKAKLFTERQLEGTREQNKIHNGPVGMITVRLVTRDKTPIPDVFVQIMKLGAYVIPPYIYRVVPETGTYARFDMSGNTDPDGSILFENVPASAVAWRGSTTHPGRGLAIPDEAYHRAEAVRIEANLQYYTRDGRTHSTQKKGQIVLEPATSKSGAQYQRKDVSYIGEVVFEVDIGAEMVKPHYRVGEKLPDGRVVGLGMDKEVGGYVKSKWYGKPAQFAERFKIPGGAVLAPLIMFTIGIALSAAFGIWQFIVAFSCWAIRHILPDPENWDRATERTMWGDPGNVTFAAMKAMFKVTSLIFFGWAMWDFARTSFPFASLLFVISAFVAYFSLKGEYDPTKPYEFMEGFIRFLIGVLVIPFMIFNGIFSSMALAWLALAFFAVLPTPVENMKGVLGQAVGKKYAQFSNHYEEWDKWIFLILMFVGLVATTGTIFPFIPRIFNIGWALTGGSLYTFWAVWGIALVSGFLSPASTRPYTGILVVGTAFVLFTFTVGSNQVGTAFFGEWWPTVSTTADELLKPLGNIFSQFSNTFSQTFMMLTNPVGFAHSVMEGNYAQNELGQTGAYGVEIESMHADKIYLEELFNIRANLANRGPEEATNIKFRLTSNNEDIKVNGNAFAYLGEKDKYGKPLYSYDLDLPKKELAENDIEPVYIYGNMNCGAATQKIFQNMFSNKQTEVRDIKIDFKITINYTYTVFSNLQIMFISEDEWKQRTKNSELQLKAVPSQISTSPAKLSLDTMDQPVQEGAPFFIAFNITPEEPNSMVGDAAIEIAIPKEFGIPTACTYPLDVDRSYRIKDPLKPLREFIANSRKPKNTVVYESEDKIYLFWFLQGNRKDIYCHFNSAPKIDAPEKTYTIMAESEFEFSKWDSTSTLIAFDDACLKVAEESLGQKSYPPSECSTTATDFSRGTVVLSEMTGYTIPTKEKIKAVLSSCSRSADFTASAEHFYDLGVRYDIDPAFVVAVAALESGWGSSPIASDCKNVFNINYVSGGAYSSCTGHSRYVQYLSYQQGIDVFCDSLIMETYVKKHNQKTPAQITCATWSGVTDHCYCCDVISERDAWADQVAAIRAKFQQ